MTVATADICAGKHQGNLFSLAAFERAAATLPEARARVLRIIHDAGENGATCAEVAERMGVEMHAVSGRLSELKRDGQIVAAVDRDGRPVRRKGRGGGWGQVFIVRGDQ